MAMTGSPRGLRRLSRWFALAFLAALAGFAAAAAAGDEAALDRLVRAYPDYLAGHDATALIWRDGTRMPLSDGRPSGDFAEVLRHGSILDQIRLPYPAGATAAMAGPSGDPGRVRNRAFFDKMYGDCWRGEVRPRLVPIVWLPRSWGRTVEIISVNGVAERLAAVSQELDALPDSLKRYAYPPAGTYNCRTVADTGQPSMHAWGAAIDISTAQADYWLNHRSGNDAAGYVNRIPVEIVDIFERHGFIWGGKWFHYDTMHFEFRPELLDGQPTAALRPAASELHPTGVDASRRP
jgi:D-alanyl-D-alanine carboxypeptidase